MERVYLNIGKLNALEKEWILNETWCESCTTADLGIMDPIYYREARKEYIAGKCKVCGLIQTTEIVPRPMAY